MKVLVYIETKEGAPVPGSLEQRRQQLMEQRLPY